MRVFSLAVIAAVLIALGAASGLSVLQGSSANAETTGSARLNHDESVNFYGRPG